ncbi:AraC family transcriptional regulator [Oceanobacillus zhaokaii]|uniref:AraC family transcriptional regulator n=1 Tax=Oceanobacillus zhaokaii TaxID=2052660 RepID=A0A345PEQ4_9BACI|nr:effector binding domain-containing protein [Oceanobacillus zhaokaii]AXI08484.1 AraC family transcriptional regulator [Oceanobacillus zhaokaii]
MKLSIITSIRTNNFNDERVMQKITEMWKEASNRLTKNENITYGVYHNYESDYKGDYSLSVGSEDTNGKSFIEIPKNEKYEIFKVNTTEEQGIFNSWSKIWDQEEAGTLERAYSFDFEKYYPNGEIEIHIAIK